MNMREKIARAIYDKSTRFDGDEIAVHLSNSMMIDGSAVNAEDLKSIVFQVCEDAADAALDALLNPTEGMHRVGTDRDDGGDRTNSIGVFQAMIKAAKEGK